MNTPNINIGNITFTPDLIQYMTDTFLPENETNFAYNRLISDCVTIQADIIEIWINSLDDCEATDKQIRKLLKKIQGIRDEFEQLIEILRNANNITPAD